ncbi:hypothetical protein [Pyruvatibacter sp.]
MTAVSAAEWMRREALVFAQIERAALEGHAAPSHEQLQETTGVTSSQMTVARLIAQGRIASHAKFPMRRTNQLFYEVTDPASAAFGKRTAANGKSRAGETRHALGVERPCISCSTKMHSTGPHHRMCDRCRARGADTLPELTLSTGTWHPTTRGGVV